MGMRLPNRLMSCAWLGQVTNLRLPNGGCHAPGGFGFVPEFPKGKLESFPGLLTPCCFLRRHLKVRRAFMDRRTFKSRMLSNDKTRRRYR